MSDGTPKTLTDADLDEATDLCKPLDGTRLPPTRFAGLCQRLAYQFAYTILNSELRRDDDGWLDELSNEGTEEHFPECLEYLTLRGLIHRREGAPQWIAIREEPEADR